MMIRRLRQGLLSLLVFAMTCSLARCEDWSRFRGPDLNGVSVETDWTHQWPEGGPDVAWTASVGVGLSSMSIQGGRLYTIGNEENVDTVWCLDAETGKVNWKHSYASPTDPYEFDGGPTSTPTIDNDTVYTLSRAGDLFAMDADSGKVLWSKNVAVETNVRTPGWGFSGSPCVVGKLLVVNVGDAGTAVDKDTGEVVWASADKDAGYSSAVPTTDGGIILGSSRSYVCVDAKSGAERWRQRWLTTFGCNAADAIVSDRYVLLSSAYNRGSALLDISDDQPKVVWKHKDFQNQLSASVRIDDHLYGVDGDVNEGAKLTCIDLLSGEVAWSDDSTRYGAISAAGDRLILLSDSGTLMVAQASPKSFSVLASHKILDGTCWTAPVLCDGRIFCRDSSGQIACVDVRGR